MHAAQIQGSNCMGSFIAVAETETVRQKPENMRLEGGHQGACLILTYKMLDLKVLGDIKVHA